MNFRRAWAAAITVADALPMAADAKAAGVIMAAKAAGVVACAANTVIAVGVDIAAKTKVAARAKAGRSLRRMPLTQKVTAKCQCRAITSEARSGTIGIDINMQKAGDVIPGLFLSFRMFTELSGRFAIGAVPTWGAVAIAFALLQELGRALAVPILLAAAFTLAAPVSATITRRLASVMGTITGVCFANVGTIAV